VAFADALQLDQLNAAINTRDLIGQAQGMLMERYAIDGDQAFRLLTRISQSSNRKIRDIADELISTRRIQGLRPPKTAR
jgi:AmiR/NasT family two-component response regulator